VHEKRDAGIRFEVVRLARGSRRRHDYNRRARVGCGGEVGVVHEGNMGDVV
jgi:hypothetical protein